MERTNDTDNVTYEIEYKRWDRVVLVAQFVMVCFVFLIEVVNNILLYVTRSQGYGPDTIVQKLLRYLVLTSVINFGLFLLSFIVEHKVKNETIKKFSLMLFVTLICSDVAFSHYQFATTLAIFVIPLVISILYEDWKLSVFTFVSCLCGEVVAVMARAKDPLYNKYIGPEAAIAFTLIITVFIFAKLVNMTLEKRRNDAEQAVIRAEKIRTSAEKMAFSFKMLETLAGTLDAKDKYTNGHSLRVATYATQLAEALGWDEERIEQLRFEALLHDIGKIGVPDAILNKPARLSDTEFDLIKSHTVVGSDILKNMVAVPNATEVARHHHERYDGNGYPDRLKEEAIPINARIVGIADAYDAMNSDRIYRPALSKDIIRQELVKGSGSQFDPHMLTVFLQLFDEDKLEVKSDDLVISDTDSKQQNVVDDIEHVINRIMVSEDQVVLQSEFQKFYSYMCNIGARYNRSIEVLAIDIVAKHDALLYEKRMELADALQVAVKKNIRAVDVYYQYSPMKHMIILLDAGVENIDVIQKRIEYDYNLVESTKNSKLHFSLNESISAPNKKVK